LPGTQEQDEQHQRHSDAATMQGSVAAASVASISKLAMQPSTKVPTPHVATAKPQPSGRPQQSSKLLPERHVLAHSPQATDVEQQQSVTHPNAGERRSESNRLDSATVMMQIQDPTPPHQTVMHQLQPPANPNAPANTAASPAPLFEEMVQQPELVELIENDGAHTNTNVFQNGGRSEGGTGAANDLNNYIKDLHKRIKNCWSPPRGQSRHAKLLFRIQKNGQLSFVKLLISSGDAETDTAAINSVRTATSQHPLPADYGFPYLDVQYVFNYAADELKEQGQ
jgi:outer membrane biosynthesis protein TonB